MAIETNVNITDPTRTDSSGTVIPVDLVQHVDGSGNLSIVFQRTADVDGTSGYLLTNTSVSNSGGGVSTSNNFGAWSAWSPTSASDASQCNQPNITITQSRSRTHSITTTTAAVYQTTVSTYTCSVLTSPTGSGTQPSCVSPSGAVGSSYNTSNTVLIANATSSTTGQPNQTETRSQSVTNTAYVPSTTVFVRDTSIPLTGGVFTQTDPGTCNPVDESIGCGTSAFNCTVSSLRTPTGNKTAVMQTGNMVTTDCFGGTGTGGQIQTVYFAAITDGSAFGAPVACTITYPNPDLAVCETGTSLGFGSQELCNGTIVSGAQTACFKTGQSGINYSGTSCS